MMETLKRYVALVVKFNPLTGERAAGIDVKTDRGLICLPLWQDVGRGIEMRLVVDDRDVSRYEGVEGIEIVKGKDAINAKVKELFKPQYSVASPELFRVSLESLMKAGTISLSELRGLPPEEQLRICYEKGCLGMRKREPHVIP
jgi:hypothetical protein